MRRSKRLGEFILTVQYPPNPIRALDNVLTASQHAGRDLYIDPSQLTDTVRSCNGCHVLDPAQGFFGTDGESTFENETQLFKIAHLRSAYTKVGMFGFPDVAFIGPTDHAHQGEQIRGFGFLHDGSIDTMHRFLNATVFGLTNTQRLNLEQFVLAFDTNLAPAVGQQVTRNPKGDASVDARIDLLVARAAAGECDLVAKGNLAGERIGVDRDGDATCDRDELDAGTNPADPDSFPPPCANLPGQAAQGCAIAGG